MTPDLVTAQLVVTDITQTDRPAVIKQLVDRLVIDGRVLDGEGFFEDVMDRERQMATGMPGEVGLPHARSVHVRSVSIAVARVLDGVDFGGPDGPVHLVVLVAAPDDGPTLLRLLAAMARALVTPTFRSQLLKSVDRHEIAHIMSDAIDAAA